MFYAKKKKQQKNSPYSVYKQVLFEDNVARL